MKNKLILIFLIFNFTLLQAQINQFDANGKRHGTWQKNYRNGNIRYKGTFYHGKEIGVFRYYSLESATNPVVIKKFNKNDDIALVKFYTPTGKLLSVGKMKGKKRIEKWVYYHKNGKTIMQEENYVDGKLDGVYTTYFITKKPTIEAHYKNGLLDGSYKRYSIKGFVYQDLNYKNGALNGSATYYNRLTGELIKKGFFKNDIKTGIWELYYKGELIDSKDHTPKPRHYKKKK